MENTPHKSTLTFTYLFLQSETTKKRYQLWMRHAYFDVEFTRYICRFWAITVLTYMAILDLY